MSTSNHEWHTQAIRVIKERLQRHEPRPPFTPPLRLHLSTCGFLAHISLMHSANMWTDAEDSQSTGSFFIPELEAGQLNVFRVPWWGFTVSPSSFISSENQWFSSAAGKLLKRTTSKSPCIELLNVVDWWLENENKHWYTDKKEEGWCHTCHDNLKEALNSRSNFVLLKRIDPATHSVRWALF